MMGLFVIDVDRKVNCELGSVDGCPGVNVHDNNVIIHKSGPY